MGQSAVSDTAAIAPVVVRGVLLRDTLRNIPASVAVLDRARLSQNDGTILTSLLNEVPGVQMQQGALNTNRIAIRGIGARSQYSTNRVKAYLDGIPISSAAGTTVIEDIDMDVLESVEIIKGPASSIYGTGLGGVINLYTRDRPSSTAAYGSTVGSFGLQKHMLRAGLDGKKASAEITYNHLQRDGFRDNSAYDRKSLSLTGKYRFSDATTLSVLAILTRMKGHIPSSINRTMFENEPHRADANWEAAQGFESYDRLVAGISLKHHFSDAFSNTTSLFTHIRDAYEPRPFDILAETRKGAGARTQFNLEHTLFGLPARLAFGAEVLVEDYEGGTIENRFRQFPGQGSVEGAQLSANTQLRTNSNAFVQQHLRLSAKWAIEAGLNVNSTRYTLTDLFASDSLDQSGDYRFGTIASPRLGVTYRVAPDKVIYATASHGFSAPGVEETLTPSGVVNTELLPETGINYELGLKADWLGGKLYSEVAVYTMEIQNLLVARRIAEDQFIGINAGRTSHTGAEATLSYRQMLGEKWLLKPYINASLHHFRFSEFIDNDADYSGNALTGVPTHTANLGFEAESVGGLHFRANLLHTGDIPLNDGNTAYADSYALLNVQVAYERRVYNAFHVRIEAGINNVLDAQYAASVLPNAIGFGGNDPRYFYPGDPRNWYVGVRVGI